MAISESKKEMVAALEKIISITSKMGVKIEKFERGSVKVKLPKEPNVNHIGIIYAGSLFSLADYAGGILHCSCFDLKQYYPLLKNASIVYKCPATTDVTVEMSLTTEEIEDVRKTADSTGKADFVKEVELKDTDGNVCCVVRGSFQVRKAS